MDDPLMISGRGRDIIGIAENLTTYFHGESNI